MRYVEYEVWDNKMCMIGVYELGHRAQQLFGVWCVEYEVYA